jgi:hypothetical protein
MSLDTPPPPLPEPASPELIAMNEALWAWANAGSFRVKAALLQCLHQHDVEARSINHHIGDIARAWGAYLESLSRSSKPPEGDDLGG